MKYSKFIINHYKAINGELEIDVTKKPLIPVIGKNESGKTSILWGIFAFDKANDNLNDGRHHVNVGNLYKTTDRGVASITAHIEFDISEISDIISDIETSAEMPVDMKASLKKLKLALNKIPNCLIIKRTLPSLGYTIENSELSKFKALFPYIVEEVLARTPYILYFDDFRDTVDEEIEINEEGRKKGWLTIIEQLFKKTNKDYSVYKLSGMEPLQRKSVLADVCKTLNDTLAKEWEKFTLEEDQGARLDVDLQYSNDDQKPRITLLIKENVNGNDRFFGIRDRSKGFFWFFNFVMKLEFNPKVRSLDDTDTIYLLDEPGSYLHSSAQTKLCEKLAFLARKNVVIYCTHSHYLLDPDKIPLSYIKIAQKGKDGGVGLTTLLEYNDAKNDKKLAIQPIIDALKIKPFLTDLNHEKICITEGIYDYYVFEMFKETTHNIKMMPAVNAESIKYFISIAIGWKLKYVAMWDNDDEGRKEYQKAVNFFGESESKKFILLPTEEKRNKTILQDLFDGVDLNLIRTNLELPTNTSFEKTIMLLYFSPDEESIISQMTGDTKVRIRFTLSEIIKLIN
jgi:AAA ATPase domain